MGELLVAFWPVSLTLSGKATGQGKNPNPIRRENCVRNDTQGYSDLYTCKLSPVHTLTAYPQKFIFSNFLCIC